MRERGGCDGDCCLTWARVALTRLEKGVLYTVHVAVQIGVCVHVCTCSCLNGLGQSRLLPHPLVWVQLHVTFCVCECVCVCVHVSKAAIKMVSSSYMYMYTCIPIYMQQLQLLAQNCSDKVLCQTYCFEPLTSLPPLTAWWTETWLDIVCLGYNYMCRTSFKEARKCPLLRG